jgi:hypothetical protein
MLQPLLMMRTRGLSGVMMAKHAFQKTKLSRSNGAFVSDGIGGLIIWAAIPDTNVSQGLAWTIDLNDHVTGAPVITFAVNTGGPPTGITLNANGTFSGTVTNVSGAGSVTYTATNSAGVAISGTHSWTIP